MTPDARPVLVTTLWLALAHAIALGAVAAFLYTPESNVLMLALSALLVLATLVVLLMASTSAAHALVHRQAPWRSLGAAARLLPLVLVGVLVVGVICGAAGAFESWWVSRAGEIDATAIAAGDITNTGPLHAAVRWLVRAVQWVLVPAWLAACLAWAAAYERRDVLGLKWLAASLRWRLLGVAVAAVVLLVWLPWHYVYWRPRALPASSIEIAWFAIKMGVIYLLAQLAWALTLWTATRDVAPATPTGGPDR